MLTTWLVKLLFYLGLPLVAITPFFFEHYADPTPILSEPLDTPDSTVSVRSFTEAKDYFYEYAVTNGAVEAFEVLKVTRLSSDIDMHLLGHVVGDILYEQEGIAGMSYCTHDFRNACSHSVVIGALLDHGLEIFDEINAICKQAPGGKGAYTMCFHGFGHGVLAYTEYSFKEAVELCELVGTAQYERQEAFECIGGVVMEMKEGIHDMNTWRARYDSFYDFDDPMWFCTASFMPREARSRCLSYATPYLFDAAAETHNVQPRPYLFADAMQLCVTLDDENDQSVCYAGFGKEYIVIAANYNTQEIASLPNDRLQLAIDWCDFAPDARGALECKIEIVDSLYWGGENEPDAVLRYCDLMTTSADKTTCWSHLLNLVSQYKTGSINHTQQVCKQAPKAISTNYTTVCQ